MSAVRICLRNLLDLLVIRYSFIIETVKEYSDRLNAR